MRNKIEDTKVEQTDMDKMKEMAKQMLGLSGTTKGFGSPKKSTTTVTNGFGSGSSSNVDENGEEKAKPIQNLVRKKRKPEEEESTSPKEVKKVRQEEPVKVNGCTNGHADMN